MNILLLFIAGFGKVFCILRNNQATDYKTDWTARLSIFGSTTLVLTLFLEFLTSRDSQADIFLFWATTPFAQNGNMLFLPLLGCRLAIFLGLTFYR